MQALEYGEKFYNQERIDRELPIAALTRQLVSIHDTKNRNYKLSDFCLFSAEENKKLDISPQVANTFFTLSAQKKLPQWCLNLGLEPKELRRYTDTESGVTSPRAWVDESGEILFVSPFFFNNKLVVPLCFFGNNIKRGSVVAMRDLDSNREFRVYLDGELQRITGWCDKETFELVREIKAKENDSYFL
ncbi:MAG: hypothetical protein QNJ54_16240 [Prochloraceae cyanobacterium]|nr:hypothetical protein [Prochloraceae cyanobacterium]